MLEGLSIKVHFLEDVVSICIKNLKTLVFFDSAVPTLEILILEMY